MAEAWYYSAGGAKQGPIDTAELKRLAGTGTIKPETLIWKSGLKEWVKAEKVQGLFALPADESPPLPPTLPTPPAPQIIAPTPPMPVAIAQPAVVGSSALVPPSGQSVVIPASEPMPLLSVILLFTSCAAPTALALFVLLCGSVGLRLGDNLTPLAVLAICAAMITYVVFASMDLYRFWTCVPEQFRVTTPGKAVGFTFIPFFNLYWFFVAFRGLSECTNRALSSRGLPTTAPVGLATALAIILIVSFAGLLIHPMLYFIGCSGAYIVWVLWLMGQCNATFTLLGHESPAPMLKKWFVGICIGVGLNFLLSLMGGIGGVGPQDPYNLLRRYNEQLSRDLQQTRDAFRPYDGH